MGKLDPRLPLNIVLHDLLSTDKNDIKDFHCEQCGTKVATLLVGSKKVRVYEPDGREWEYQIPKNDDMKTSKQQQEKEWAATQILLATHMANVQGQ